MTEKQVFIYVGEVLISDNATWNMYGDKTWREVLEE